MEEKEEESIAVQEVWSWGAGTEGQLGTEKLQDEHEPQLIRSLSTFDPISFLSCGGAHVIALIPGGRVLTWGRGTSGQLGHGEMVNSLEPKPLESLGGFVITHVSAGWNHSGFVSENGCLFTCGDGSFGQLGHGDYDSRCSPEKVSYLDSMPVQQIACGMRHSLALVKDDVGYRVHGFGSGKRGQLGISKDKVRLINIPQATLGLEDVIIVSIHADGDHSAALSDDGRLYTWGRGFSGASDTHVPLCVFTDLSFSQAALGWNHALLLTADAEIFMLGSYGNGILINSYIENQETHRTKNSTGPLSRIPGLTGRKILQIAAGAEHSTLVSDDAKIMTWGWGEHGQLGLGHTVDQTIPQIHSLFVHLQSFRDKFCRQLYSGMSRKRDRAQFSRQAPYSFSKRRRPLPPPKFGTSNELSLPDDGNSSVAGASTKRQMTVVVLGLPSNCSVLDLKSRFEIYGSISRTRMEPNGLAYVTFRSHDSAQSAISASLDPSFGITILSKSVQVMWATDPVPQWREGVAKREGMPSKLVRAEIPLSRRGRSNKLGSAIVNPRDENNTNDSVKHDSNKKDGGGNTVSGSNEAFKGREIIAYDDIL